MEKNKWQGVISRRRLEEMKWCGCIGKAVHPKEGKTQQSSAQTREPEYAAKERGSQREVRRTFQILKEVWLNVGVEKLDMLLRCKQIFCGR